MHIEYKIIVLGNPNVGKSALIVQFTQGVFIQRYVPTIEDSYNTYLDIEGKQYHLEILDTDGSEQFDVMRNIYIKDGDGILLVFSVEDYNSFTEAERLYNQIIKIKGSNKGDNINMILIGNKCDNELKRVITVGKARQKAN